MHKAQIFLNDALILEVWKGSCGENYVVLKSKDGFSFTKMKYFAMIMFIWCHIIGLLFLHIKRQTLIVILLSHIFYLHAVFPMWHATHIVYESSGIYFSFADLAFAFIFLLRQSESFFSSILLLPWPHTSCTMSMHLWHHF